MKSFFPFFLGLLFLANVCDGTVLGDLAASMKAGEWRKLNVTFNPPDLLNDCSNSWGCSVLEYSDKGVWDPIGGQLLFVGGGHLQRGSSRTFVNYSDQKNQFEKRNPGFSGGHTYHCNAIDPVNRKFYVQFQQYDLTNSSWKSLPSISGANFYSGQMASEYFPDLKRYMVFGNGGCWLLNETTNQWTTVKPFGTLKGSGLHEIAEYNPVHHVVLCGAGNYGQILYKMDLSGNLTQLNTTVPSDLYIEIRKSITTVDPVSGDYLFFGKNKVFYTYNIKTNTWEKQGGPIGIFETPVRDDYPTFDIIAASVSTYGVNMFVKLYFDQYFVYLYKHTDGQVRIQKPPSNFQDREIQLSVIPNPLSTSAHINLRSAKKFNGVFRIEIYNAMGKKVKTLTPIGEGKNTLNGFWDGSNNENIQASPGVYLVKIQSKERSLNSKRIVKIR